MNRVVTHSLSPSAVCLWALWIYGYGIGFQGVKPKLKTLNQRCVPLQGMVHQAIMGDLNTMAHGVARLSPSYCCDILRWRALGWYEAAWWDRFVLSEVRSPWQILRC